MFVLGGFQGYTFQLPVDTPACFVIKLLFLCEWFQKSGKKILKLGCFFTQFQTDWSLLSSRHLCRSQKFRDSDAFKILKLGQELS